MVMQVQVVKRYALALEEDVLSIESAVEAVAAILGEPPIGGSEWPSNPGSGGVTAAIFGSRAYIDVYLQDRRMPVLPLDLSFGQDTEREVRDILETHLTVKGYAAFNIATGEGKIRVLYFDSEDWDGLSEIE